MKTSRKLLVPASFLIASVALGGCSSSGSTTEETAKASASESAASSASESSAASGGGEASGTKVPAADVAQRMLDAMKKAGTVKVVTDMGGMGKMDLNNKYEGDKASSQGSVEFSGIKMEIISIDNGAQMYLKAPAMGLNNWEKVDANSSNPAVQQMAKQMESMKSQMDPSASVRMYEKAGEFTSAGEADVNGVKTTKYTGTIPGKVMMEAAGPAAAQAAPSGASLPDAPTELYLDAENRPVKQVITMDMGGQKIATTTTYSDYGKPVEIKAPA